MYYFFGRGREVNQRISELSAKQDKQGEEIKEYTRKMQDTLKTAETFIKQQQRTPKHSKQDETVSTGPKMG